MVTFDLLEKFQTDPPNVLTLEETAAQIEQLILQNKLTVSISTHELVNNKNIN